MKPKKSLEGVMPKPVSDEDVTKRVKAMTEYKARAGAYWEFVANEICALNHAVYAARAAA